MDNRPIGIFDSGIGGLTVFKEIRALLPNEDLIYFGDTARVPYGSKSVQVIRNFSSEIAAFLSLQNVKMLVIACNTASALALSSLRNETSLPVIGVIDPGVRAAVKVAGDGPVGVIGTRATIKSGAYQDRIIRLRCNLKVLARACPLLVPIVEENLMNSDIARMALNMYLSDFKKQEVSSLILACTHYPLLKTLINEYFEGKTRLIDSACETACEVKEVLHARRINSCATSAGRETFFVSDSPEAFSEIATDFLGRPIAGECFLHSWQSEN
ncbi:MAG TPA: glutamate racemase [Candidatus Riflebacteria bacterium]|jgi:glutamate racemase|nr:glutamate racemase [Candidatus Riflebacteria bacterium]